MTVPASFGTCRTVIEQAYENCGIVAEGSLPLSEQYARGLTRLNQLVNYLQTRGLKLWTIVDTSLGLTAGTNQYTLGPGALTGVSMTKPLRAISGYFLDSNGNKTPMTPLSWQEISILNISGASGLPVNYFTDKQLTKLVVTLWPTPDSTSATGSVHLILQTQIGNGVALTDATMFPPEWTIGLAWMLADELSAGQPASVIERCRTRAAELRSDLEGWDVEDAQTFFTPDIRSMNQGGSFV
jgi:hypothetical protein